MRPMQLPVSLCGALALLMPGAVFAQHEHAAHVAAPVPPLAQRWAADATLSADMGQIHTVLEQLRHDEMGHMDATLALDRVAVIQVSAAGIFAKCRLAPTQDAVLHGMLVPLLAAVQKFRANPRTWPSWRRCARRWRAIRATSMRRAGRPKRRMRAERPLR
jgi:hypothetical protein